MINFEDWQKIDIRIGKIKEAERIEGTAKLLKLKVEFGSEERQLVAGIGDQYEPEKLVGKEIPILANLEPKELKGVLSQGMILVANDNGNYVLLTPEKDIPSGTKIE